MIPLLASALGAALGLQMLRAFFPLLLYVLKDRVGQPSPVLGAEAILLFATGFLVPRFVRRRDGFANALIVLAVLRGAFQLWRGDPAVSLGIAAAAVPAFLAVLAATAPGKATAFLLGALLDVAVHAAAGTRDLHWGGGGADLAAGALVGAALAGAWAVRRTAPAKIPNHGFVTAAGALAWGPFLLLQLEVLGNVARASARTGLPTALSGAAVAAGFAIAALLAPRIERLRGGARTFVVTLAGAALVALVPVPGSAAFALGTLVVVQLAAAALLVRAVAPAEASPGSHGHPLPFGLGAVLLVVLLFLHYAGYDLPLNFSGPTAWRAAAVLLAAAALASRGGSPSTAAPLPARLAVAAAALALVPLAHAARRTSPPPADPGGAIVVSFNLHAGFDERGAWAFDRMMAELRSRRPDVVALQEVSRGWLINGGADLFELARERLGLEGVAGPSVRTDWGNAVFARRKILSATTTRLPPRMNLSRAVTRVELAEGRGPRVVLATHLHHREGDDSIRDEQASAIAAAFPATPDAVLLGDFNAQPEARTFEILRRSGWIDAAGDPEEAARAPTFPSRDPVRRIDTILVGDPERVAGCDVEPAWGSDHRSVVLRWNPAAGRAASGR